MIKLELTESQACTILTAIKYESTYYEYEDLKEYYNELIKMIEKEIDKHFCDRS